MSTDDLKEVAKLRKAIAPLISLMKTEASLEVSKRLETIEASLAELAKKDYRVEVNPPEVTVNMDVERLIETIEKQNSVIAKKSTDQPSAYEPHDQAKTGIYQYSGFVRSDGAWYIQRVAKGEQRYTKGRGSYGESWDKRDKLGYGYLDESA